MWDSNFTTPPFAMVDLAIDAPLAPLRIPKDMNGAHVIVRHRDRPVGRFWLSRVKDGDVVSVKTLQTRMDLILDAAFGDAFVADLSPVQPADPPPSLTLAICTRNRPALLRRCVQAASSLRDPITGGIPELLVVDNAPSDTGTRDVVAEFPSVRYVVEPVPGLDFGRNRALTESRSDWLGFVDDDAIPDRGWLGAVFEGIADTPTAGGFAGPIMPLMLDTEAQLRFERSGGFGKGFDFKRFGHARFGDPFYPMGQGGFGTGASMVFSTNILREIGGFDTALDTGPPLPGGGDSDAYYRVIKAGHPVVYLPGLMVHHEHRRDMVGLRKQYHSWGLTNGALLGKARQQEPQDYTLHRRHLAVYFLIRARRLALSLLGRGPSTPSLIAAELYGLIKGSRGEYARSQARVAVRQKEHGS